MKKVLVLGAAGFLGSALEHRLKENGDCRVISVARKPPLYRKSVADEYNILDLENVAEFHSHFHRHHFDEVYQMAGYVGGLGYIGDSKNDVDILTKSFKINLYTLEAIQKSGNCCDKVFFASSQCVYPNRIEVDPYANERIAPPYEPLPFSETHASFNNFAFAKEKLYAESLYEAYGRQYGIDICIGRLGNTYGPYCEWKDPKAKAVAAICRKVAEAPYGGVVKLWGDGSQTRSFTYVDDVTEGIVRLMKSNYNKPVNIASGETVSISGLFEAVCKEAGKILAWEREDGPVGASHRGSDNSLVRHILGWEPTTSLADGLHKTWRWVAGQVLTRETAV